MKRLAFLIIMACFIVIGITAQQNTMVRINGGTFTMGSPANEAGRRNDEIQRQVTVSSFYMSRYPITQREYQEIMGTNPSHFRGNTLPVENVSWWDAVEYCNRRSHREGLTLAYTIDRERGIVTWNRNANGYRLPTEAEWEFAARAGTTTPWNTGNTITSEQANFNSLEHWVEEIETRTEWGTVERQRINRQRGEFRGTTTPVGSFPANAWGLHDKHGNVWEWCWDWYGPYATGAQNNPTGVLFPASFACFAAGRGTLTVRTFVRLFGTSTFRRTGTTISVSVWFAPEFCEKSKGKKRSAAVRYSGRRARSACPLLELK